MKEVKLPSGATLKLHLAPFTVSKALYQAVAEEFKDLKLDPLAEIDVNLYKSLFMTAISSKKIEACTWACMKKAIIDDLPITEETFEPEAARDDYMTVCLEVARVNIAPFTKSLYAQYKPVLEMLLSDQALKLLMTPT